MFSVAELALRKTKLSEITPRFVRDSVLEAVSKEIDLAGFLFSLRESVLFFKCTTETVLSLLFEEAT